jgi:hypothetical protein
MNLEKIKKYTLPKFKDGVPTGKIHLFRILLIFFLGNFKNERRFVIYLYNYIGWIDLREKNSEGYKDIDLVKLFDKYTSLRITTKEIFETIGLSRNSFKEYFKNYIEQNGIANKRLNSIDVYKFLLEFQGDNPDWTLMAVVRKKDFANALNTTYKELAKGLELYKPNGQHKKRDKLTPSEIKGYLKHIGFDQEEIEDLLFELI